MSQNLSASGSLAATQATGSSIDSDVYTPGEKYNPPFANEPNTYKELRKEQELKRNEWLSSAKRYQRLSEREDRSDMPVAAWVCNSAGKYLTRYRGFDICKSPLDFVLYHQLLDLVKPKTIIELGTLSGGMAIWMADTLGLLDIKSDIYSMDLDPSNRSELVNKFKPDNVTFLQGDAFEIERTFTDKFLKSLPHPWVFIEDAHANLPGVLRYFHQYCHEGDYMVVEDTCPDLAKECGMGMRFVQPTEFRTMGRKQLDCLREFLHEYEDFYAVDSFLTDLFGYNSSAHWHGFIRKMK